MSLVPKIGLSITIIFITTIVNGCATSISVPEKYRELDGAEKAIFLSRYPDLTLEDKTELLKNPEKLPRQPVLRKLVSLQILPSLTKPIEEGESIEFQAFARFSDGTAINTTPDTTWIAMPSIVKIDGNKLHFECINSDISISASFLDEINATQILSIRKPLKTIQARVAESSSIIDNSSFIKLISRAICKDGTTTEVSCQTIWNVASEWGSIQGCGELLPSLQSWRDGYALVTVSYGNLTIKQKVYLPARATLR